MEEKMRILKMVEDGTITAAEAAELMSAMGVEEASGLAAEADLRQKDVPHHCGQRAG